MANVKITELTALTAAAADDVVAIVDITASETKKITACCFVTQAFEDFTVGDDLCFSSAGAVINFNSADVTITHASNSLTFDGGSVIFNEAGGAFDVRMEGDTEANLFIADASADRIGIGTATPATLLHVQGAACITGDITSAGDLCFSAAGGVINFNSGDVTITHSTNALTFDGGGVVFNEAGGAFDLRIEGDSEANLFIADASTDRIGIGTATPAVELDVEGDIAIGNQDKLYFDGGVHTFICETSGSTLIFAVADTAVMCLNDGYHMVVNSCLKVGIAATGADASFNAECSGKQVCWDASYQSGVGGLVIVDTTRLVFGSGCDAEMYYDGSTLTLNPRVVGTGNFSVGGGATCLLVYGATSKTGLGTSAPDSKVHIYTGAGGAAADSAADELNIEGSSSQVGMTISGPASNEGNIFFADASSSTVGRITYAHAANCFYFTTNSVAALYIDSAQNVGVGRSGV